MAKVIATDNFDRPTISDRLISSTIGGKPMNMKEAIRFAKSLNDNAPKGDNSPWYYKAVKDDYILYSYNPNE